MSPESESNGKSVRIEHLEQCYKEIAPRLMGLEATLNRIDKRVEVYIAGREAGSCGVRTELLNAINRKEEDILKIVTEIDDRKVDKESLAWLWRIVTIEGSVIAGALSLALALKALGAW